MIWKCTRSTQLLMSNFTKQICRTRFPFSNFWAFPSLIRPFCARQYVWAVVGFIVTSDDLNKLTGSFRNMLGIPLASGQSCGTKSGIKTTMYFPWRFSLGLSVLFHWQPFCSTVSIVSPQQKCAVEKVLPH